MDFFNSSLKPSLRAIDDKDVAINGCFRKTKVWVESQISMVVFVSTHSALSKKLLSACVFLKCFVLECSKSFFK